MTEKVKNIVISLMFVAIIILMLIINIFKEDTEISVSERRKLAVFPEISLSNILSGKFTKEFENYTMDQFFSREVFRKLKANAQIKIFNKKDFNGIYEYNGSLIKQEYPLNEKSVLNVANKINEIQEKYLNEDNKVYYSIIPDKNYFTDENLKLDYDNLQNIMKDNLQNIQYIDIFGALSLDDYYYTDIHWRQEAILDVVDVIANKMKFKKDLSKGYTVTEILDFKGVYSGQYPLDSKTDKLKVLTNEEIQKSSVYNFDTKSESKVYNLEKKTSNDKYDIYLSGPSSILEIKNENAKIKKELIIFRDSFGSSLAPLFIEAYETITLIDLRYINLNLLKEYVKFDEKDILFLYSTSIINNSESFK